MRKEGLGELLECDAVIRKELNKKCSQVIESYQPPGLSNDENETQTKIFPLSRKEKRQKKKQMTRIDGQPKRPQSAYFIFMTATKELIKAKNTDDVNGRTISELTKITGERWNSMTDDDKAVS